MEKEEAIEVAKSFIDDWEIDPKKMEADHKLTGLHFGPGSTFRAGKLPLPEGAPKTIPFKEIGRLMWQFEILRDAGYMPGGTEEEAKEYFRKLEEEWARDAKETEERAAARQKYIEEHPEEYRAMIEENRRQYRARKKKEEEDYMKFILSGPRGGIGGK